MENSSERSSNTSVYQYNVTSIMASGTTHVAQWIRGSNVSSFTIDGVSEGPTTNSAQIPAGNYSVGCQAWTYFGFTGGDTVAMNWFAVRNYVSPEPTIVASGSVQSNRSVYYPTSSYGYDWMGNMLWARLYTNTTSYYQTNYTYDLSGNLLSVTNANGQNTTYKYDDLNRLIQTSYPNGTSQYMYYDNASNLIAKTDQNGNTINCTYDALNRLAQIRYPDGSTVNYTYDMNGNLLSDIGKNVSSFYQYDARNRPFLYYGQ